MWDLKESASVDVTVKNYYITADRGNLRLRGTHETMPFKDRIKQHHSYDWVR
jgi:hypothetical protein